MLLVWKLFSTPTMTLVFVVNNATDAISEGCNIDFISISFEYLELQRRKFVGVKYLV